MMTRDETKQGALSRAVIDAEKAAKSRPDLLPGHAALAKGDVQAFGLAKHGPCTWREKGTEQADPRTHLASASRHAALVFDDPWSTDDQSGLLHLAHLGAQIDIALDCLRASDPERFDAIRAKLPEAIARMRAEQAHVLPAGWEVRQLVPGRELAVHPDTGFEIDDSDSDAALRRWASAGIHSLDTLTRVRAVVRERNGWQP